MLGLPPELYTIWESYPWRFGEPYCLFKTFLTEMTSSASILTITAFTVERYMAICHPLRAHSMSTPPRAARTIVGVWVAACVTALPYPLHTRMFYYLDDPTRPGRQLEDSLICNIPTYWQSRMRYCFQARNLHTNTSILTRQEDMNDYKQRETINTNVYNTKISIKNKLQHET